jgi:hypothetical protein
MEGAGSIGHDPPQHCDQATAAQLEAFDALLLRMDEQLAGGRTSHPCRLVFEQRFELLVGGKRGAEGAEAGSVRIMCDVCTTTHKLGEGSQICGNFFRGHLCKPEHAAKAARRAAAALDVEALPAAGIGVGVLPVEPAPAAIPVDDGALYMMPQHEAALLDLLASGLQLKGAMLHCAHCSRNLGSATDRRVINWARGHVSSEAHVRRAADASGQRKLTHFGFTLPVQQETQLCWGYHERIVTYGLSRYDVALIIARDLTNDDFVTELHTTFPYQRTSNSEPYVVRGCIRHRQCERYALDSSGSGPRLLSCSLCLAIPNVNSFRMLARREQYRVRAPDDPPFVPSSSINFRHMPLAEIVPLARDINARRRDALFQNMQLRRKLVAARARARTLAEKLGEMSARGEIKQLFDYILRCERAGKFEERKVLFDFISDMLRSLALTDADTGRRSNNMRWSSSTLRVFACIKLLGGPKLNRFFAATLEAPSASTISRTLAQTKLHLPVGPDAGVFKQIGEVYGELKRLLGITGPVPFELSEDETGVQVGATLCARTNTIRDFCGAIGVNHCCDESCSVFIGGREVAYEQIVQAFKTRKRSTSMRLLVVNPIHPELPKFAISAHGTCNGFSAAFIANSWRGVRELSAQHLEGPLGPLIGHASDGDARRFHNQLAEMSSPPPAGSHAYALDAEGFTLHGLWDGQDARTIHLIHSQDPRHNLAKLYSHCAVPSRVLHYGTFVASHPLLVSVLHAARDRGEPIQGVTESDLARKDRQVRRAQQRPASNLRSGLPAQSPQRPSTLPAISPGLRPLAEQGGACQLLLDRPPSRAGAVHLWRGRWPARRRSQGHARAPRAHLGLHRPLLRHQGDARGARDARGLHHPPPPPRPAPRRLDRWPHAHAQLLLAADVPAGDPQLPLQRPAHPRGARHQPAAGGLPRGLGLGLLRDPLLDDGRLRVALGEPAHVHRRRGHRGARRRQHASELPRRPDQPDEVRLAPPQGGRRRPQARGPGQARRRPGGPQGRRHVRRSMGRRPRAR